MAFLDIVNGLPNVIETHLIFIEPAPYEETLWLVADRFVYKPYCKYSYWQEPRLCIFEANGVYKWSIKRIKTCIEEAEQRWRPICGDPYHIWFHTLQNKGCFWEASFWDS